MRVLLVTGVYPPGQCGVGDYTEKLANALANCQDIQVGVLTTAKQRCLDNSSVDLVYAVSRWTFSELPAIVGAIRQWRPDIINIQYPSQEFFSPSQGFFSRRMPSFMPLIFRLMGVPVVQTWHEPHHLKGAFHFLLLLLGGRSLIFVRGNYLALLPPLFRNLIKHYSHVVIPNASALPLSLLSEVQREEVRAKYLGRQRRLVTFFGFLHPNKGIELIFDISNSLSDSLVIAGAIKDKVYMNKLIVSARAKGWGDDQLHFTDFLTPQNAADLLAVSDSVVLPFLDGGGDWNTSIHSALAQGTLVISTAIPARGDEPKLNLYTAEPLDISDMRTALNRLAGRRAAPKPPDVQWHKIATDHMAFYHKRLGTDAREKS